MHSDDSSLQVRAASITGGPSCHTLQAYSCSLQKSVGWWLSDATKTSHSVQALEICAQVAAAAGPAPGPSSPAPDWITNFRAPAAPVAKLSPVSDASSESKDDQPLAAAALAAGADKQRSSSSEPSSQPHKVAKPRSTAAKAMPGSTRPKPSKKHSAPTAVAEPAAKRPAPAQLPTRELADSTAGAPAKHLLDGTAKPAEAAQQAEAGPPQAKKPKARTMSAPGDAVKGTAAHGAAASRPIVIAPEAAVLLQGRSR